MSVFMHYFGLEPLGNDRDKIEWIDASIFFLCLSVVFAVISMVM